MKLEVNHIEKVYFIGIGGIGMSAIARYYLLKGKRVAGYDRTESVVTRALETEGIEIFYLLDESHITGQDLVIYTPAISRDNIEYRAALEKGLPLMKRSEALGLISENYRTLAVAGTHGKTTTSTMLAHVLDTCGLDCTAFLGGISRNFDSNFVFGQSDLMVVEADEYDRSFMTLNPFRAVITSLDADHLDIYGNETAMRKTYFQFASQIAPSGTLLVHEVHQSANWERDCLTYGITKGHFRAENLRHEDLQSTFDFVSKELRIENLCLHMPGQHNVANMVAALAIATLEGARPELMRAAVSSFEGIYRRFEVHHHSQVLTYIDDYAHHPSELEAVISAVRELFPERQLLTVFQPHLFSRTKDFQRGFAAALDQSDLAILMEIYPAREKPIPGITAQVIADQMQKSTPVVSRENLIEALSKQIGKPTVLLSLGAGDIDREVMKIAEWAKRITNSEDAILDQN